MFQPIKHSYSHQLNTLSNTILKIQIRAPVSVPLPFSFDWHKYLPLIVALPEKHSIIKCLISQKFLLYWPLRYTFFLNLSLLFPFLQTTAPNYTTSCHHTLYSNPSHTFYIIFVFTLSFQCSSKYTVRTHYLIFDLCS